MRNIFLILVFISLSSCSFFKMKSDEEPLARVFDSYLYPSDIADLIQNTNSSEDSLQILSRYVDKWITRQLLLNKAEENLPKEELDVKRELEEYRSSLLIYKYEEELIQQKLDTIVSMEEIRSYYDSNNASFKLEESIVKYLYIMVADSLIDFYKFRRLVRSDDIRDLEKVENISFNYAKKFEYVDDDWVYLSEILLRENFEIDDEIRFLERDRNIVIRKDDFDVFIKVIDYHLKGEVAPIEFVSNDIRDIIINKRRVRFFDELEKDIYKTALNYNNFEIY